MQLNCKAGIKFSAAALSVDGESFMLTQTGKLLHYIMPLLSVRAFAKDGNHFKAVVFPSPSLFFCQTGKGRHGHAFDKAASSKSLEILNSSGSGRLLKWRRCEPAVEWPRSGAMHRMS